MNRFIFGTMTLLNGLLAVVTVVGCTLVGLNLPLMESTQPLGALLGFVVGIVLAAVVCGFIAFTALVERHLRVIAESAGVTNRAAPASSRREPLL